MNKINLALIAVLVVSAIVVTVSAQEQYSCPMGGGMMYGLYGGYGSGFMILSWITYILIIALIIAAIYWLIKNANRRK